MAYALVGSVGTVATAASTVTPAFGQATTAGHLLVAWVATSSAVTVSTSATGWSSQVSAGTIQLGFIFARQNCGASETAPTFNASGTTLWAAVAEFSGGLTAAAGDEIGNGSGAGTPRVVAAIAPDFTSNGELVVTCGSHRLSMTGTTTTADTYNNGATPTSNLNNDATSSATHYRFAWGLTTGNSVADQVSQSDTSANLSDIAVCIASFMPAAAAAAAIPDVGMALTVT